MHFWVNLLFEPVAARGLGRDGELAKSIASWEVRTGRARKDRGMYKTLSSKETRKSCWLKLAFVIRQRR